MDGQAVLEIPSFPLQDTVVINGRCRLHRNGNQRVVTVEGLPVHHYGSDDVVAEAYAMVFLVDSGFAKQKEVALAFGCSIRTVRRAQRRYALGGMEALTPRPGWRAGRRRIAARRLRLIGQLKEQGVSNRKIALRLGVDEKAIRKLIGPSTLAFQEVMALAPADRSEELASPSCSQLRSDRSPLPDPAASADEDEPASMSLDVDPGNRTFDRLLACFGLIDDAAPIFSDAHAVPGAGVLLSVPLLVQSGVFHLARKLYGQIGPAFYGLRTTLLVLLLMTLQRIKLPEALKERDPVALGKILGLDRAPETKTLRRKLSVMASFKRAEQLGAELARLRVEQRGDLVGFLYVDGHVRVYHGKRDVPKAHVARRNLCMPATTDYWVNDRQGDPLLVMTAEANAGLVAILPQVLDEVRALVGPRRVTIVFDRGGWSPKLFQKLIEDNFDVLTYRKGKSRRVNPGRFIEHHAVLDGRPVTYRLHDQRVRFLKGRLRLRQVTRLSPDGHQTQVLTSRWDLPAIEVAYRMFERWRQENYFKYMREEFLIDALADYQVEPEDPTRTVPNPERRTLDKLIKSARADLQELEQAYGAAAVDNTEKKRPTIRGFKIAHGKLGRKLRAARRKLEELLARRRALPGRVLIQDISPGAVIKLANERKHLTSIIKMVAYQAESDLLSFLHPHYARADQEGRTLLHELFVASADIQVTADQLRITLAPLSSPHRTLAAEALCKTLNERTTTFPGTRLRLRFEVHPPRCFGLAFPGPNPRARSECPAIGSKADI
jgi:transposase